MSINSIKFKAHEKLINKCKNNLINIQKDLERINWFNWFWKKTSIEDRLCKTDSYLQSWINTLSYQEESFRYKVKMTFRIEVENIEKLRRDIEIKINEKESWKQIYNKKST